MRPTRRASRCRRSRAHPERDEPAMPSPIVAASESRFLRGTLTHALLQHLPDAAAGRLDKRRPRASLRGAGRCCLTSARAPASSRRRSRSSPIPRSQRCSAPRAGPRCRSWRGSPNPRPQGAALKLIGQIDRLVDCGDDVLIVDYKTNRPPPLKGGRRCKGLPFSACGLSPGAFGDLPGPHHRGRSALDRGPANHASAGRSCSTNTPRGSGIWT